MTKKTRTLAIVGAVTLGAVVVGGIAYAASKKPSQLPGGGGNAPPSPTMTPTATLANGKSYGFAGQLPAGVTTQDQLVSGLTSAGWTDVQVQYFGPTASGAAAPAGLPFAIPGVAATAYVASGVWNGPDGAPVGSGFVAAQIS